MKVISYCALVALVASSLFLAGCGGNKPVDTSKGATNLETATKAVALLVGKSKIPEAAKVMGYDAEKLKGTWLNVTGTMGPMRRLGKAKSVKDQTGEIVIVNMQFGKGALNAIMTFNEKGDVVQLEVMPAPPE